MRSQHRSTDEQVILYLLIAAIGLIPVVVVLARGQDFGAESTIGLLMLGLAVGGLGEMWRIARRRRMR
jgi:hypothetical protein